MNVKILKGHHVKLHCCGMNGVFFLPPVGQPGRLQQSLRDFQPDYFSLSEKPPEEFCLSPNVSTSSSSSCSSKSHVSVDLTQKRGEALPDPPSDLWTDYNMATGQKNLSYFCQHTRLMNLFSFSFSQLFQVW